MTNCISLLSVGCVVAFTQQPDIKVFTIHQWCFRSWVTTIHKNGICLASPFTPEPFHSIFNKDDFSLNGPLRHSQIWPLHIRLWNAQLAKEQKTAFCSMKYSMEFCKEKLTSGTLPGTSHDLPGQSPHWWGQHPTRDSPSTFPSLGTLP